MFKWAIYKSGMCMCNYNINLHLLKKCVREIFEIMILQIRIETGRLKTRMFHGLSIPKVDIDDCKIDVAYAINYPS